MKLALKRIIIFAKDVTLMYEFYRRTFDIDDGYVAADKKWAELYCDGVNIAFHNGGFSGDKVKYPKLVFYAGDVEKAKETLINRGADMGKVLVIDELALCNGKDPEGNVFQISNRK
jgi:hypothetical protein